MNIFICETDLFTTAHSTRAKAISTLKKWNSGPGVYTKAEHRRGANGYITRTIKDSISVVSIKDGGRLFYDDGVKSRGFVTLSLRKEDHNNAKNSN
tara:strand:+ start:324 stop:611 length:288 start_codon:yes stop_codon:yes gene_type:complete